MRYGIVGRGFGMYGYLPALAAKANARISTLESYREVICRRPELAALEGKVSFVPDLATLRSTCDVLVLAVRPSDQETIVQSLIAQGWRGGLILEKPMALDPCRALRLFDELTRNQINFRVGFTLRQTPWGQEVSAKLAGLNVTGGDINITWRFLADHYRHDRPTWKRHPSAGGGALRFFGIHFIALLAEVDTWNVVSCFRERIQDEEPRFSFLVENRRGRASVACDTASRENTCFSVAVATADTPVVLRQMIHPFSEAERTAPKPGNVAKEINGDLRIQYIRPIIDSLAADPTAYMERYHRHLQLWQVLEAVAASTYAS